MPIWTAYLDIIFSKRMEFFIFWIVSYPSNTFFGDFDIMFNEIEAFGVTKKFEHEG